MKRIEYYKLVRDRIPEIIQAEGKSLIMRMAQPEEARGLLESKLLEEAAELSAPNSNRKEELADLLEVIHALAALEGLQPEQLEALRAEKSRKRGGFERCIVLQEVLEP